MGAGVRDAFPPPMCCVGSCIHSFAYGNAAARPCRPAGAHPSLKSPRIMRVFLVWKRRYADVRAGTQAPPLPISTKPCGVPLPHHIAHSIAHANRTVVPIPHRIAHSIAPNHVVCHYPIGVILSIAQGWQVQRSLPWVTM